MLPRKFGRLTEDQVKEKISDLPKWAKEYVRYLEQEVERQERNLREWNEDQAPSDISWQYLMESEHYIPKHSHIRFYHDREEIPHRAYVDVFFRNDGERRVLEIQGARFYHVEPRAANSIYIVMEGNEEHAKRTKAEKEMSELQKSEGEGPLS